MLNGLGSGTFPTISFGGQPTGPEDLTGSIAHALCCPVSGESEVGFLGRMNGILGGEW